MSLFASFRPTEVSPGGVFRTTDNGTSWTAAGAPFSYFNRMTQVDSNLFAGTEYGVFVSTNDGTSWTAVNSGLTSLYIDDLAVSGTNLFAGTTEGGVFLSTNDGMSWSPVNNGLIKQNGYVPPVSAFAFSGANVFAGTGGGVFLSTNNGTSWTAVDTGLTSLYVTALAVSGTNLFAGSEGGVWRRPLSEMITSVDASFGSEPGSFRLEQSFPNPFNPSTTIRYGLPQRSSVTLAVFNTLGQKITTLVNETQEAGYQEVKFDGTNLASGVYFYRIQAGSFVQTKKFVLLR
jgi:hypothetical protein